MDGREVREARERLGLGQAELARILRVTPVTVWRWEHRRTRVPRWVASWLSWMEVTRGWVQDKPEEKKEAGHLGQRSE